MREIDLAPVLKKQRQFFSSKATIPVSFRIEQLNKLKTILTEHENEINDALKSDLHKSETEVALEVFLIVNEINFAVKHLKNWVRPIKVPSTSPLLWPGQSVVYYEPYGLTLIIGPWNFPFYLTMLPLIGAMSAGNCAVVKPSEVAPHSQKLIIKLINEHFPSEYIVAVDANAQQTAHLLEQKFDYIFFTGGTKIGKLVMAAAAKNLTPVTLELGGKSPCIVDETANMDFAARRIVWAKYANAGQICIAPDYIYVQRSCKDALIEKLKATITKFYGDNSKESKDYGRIINKNHFTRLANLLKSGNIVFGGHLHEEELYISPTLINMVSWEDPIMQEEIFGPLLPILTFDQIDEAIEMISERPKPLALYLFTRDKKIESKVLNQVSFGGGCVNDCITHIMNPHLPFGGIGTSGLGRYQGKFSFETFSHCKGIYKKMLPIDLKALYPPYSKGILRLLKRIMHAPEKPSSESDI